MMVIIAERIHLFPFRTQKLSSYTSTIFGWRRPEKIDRCHQPYENSFDTSSFFILSPAKLIRVPTKRMFWREEEQSNKNEICEFMSKWLKERIATRRRPEKIDRCHQPDKNSFNTGSFLFCIQTNVQTLATIYFLGPSPAKYRRRVRA